MINLLDLALYITLAESSLFFFVFIFQHVSID